MSNHERWVVFPLLFLALGLSFRNALTDEMDQRGFTSQQAAIKRLDADIATAELVRCQGLLVTDERGREAVLLSHEGAKVSLVAGHISTKGEFSPFARAKLQWQLIAPRAVEMAKEDDEKSGGAKPDSAPPDEPTPETGSP